jgi:hypothetical protein
MKTGMGNRKQIILASVAGVLALGACIYIYEELFASSTPPPVTQTSDESTTTTTAPAVAHVAAPAAKRVGTTAAALNPELHMDAMHLAESVVYSGTGRNIFSVNSIPVGPMVAPVAPARVKPLPPPPPPIPCPPNCPPPPPPPPIPLKFFGVETGADGKRVALLLHDDSVYIAANGDVVLRQYRVVAVETKSIQIEDMQNHNTQTLPLLVN